MICNWFLHILQMLQNSRALLLWGNLIPTDTLAVLTMRSKVKAKAEVGMGDAVVVMEIMVDGQGKGMRMIHLSPTKSFRSCHHCSADGFMRVMM